ncbi:uncharacterized protein ACR2FA_011162 [Aphomia sociella]
MAENFELFFEKIKLEMQNQTEQLTYSITRAVMAQIDEKLKPILEENKILKTNIQALEKRIEYLERDRKRNNIVIFGLAEKEKTHDELLELINNNAKTALNISIQKNEVNNVYRIGSKKKDNEKPRPVLVCFTNAWKRDEIIRNKKKFDNIYVTEDFTKKVLETRKLLQDKLKEERSNGNIAYLKYDKLIVKQGEELKTIMKSQ